MRNWATRTRSEAIGLIQYSAQSILDAAVAAEGGMPMWVEVRSATRQILVELEDTDDDSSWAMLLVPEGSTDVQVIGWVERYLPSPHASALRAAIEYDG